MTAALLCAFAMLTARTQAEEAAMPAMSFDEAVRAAIAKNPTAELARQEIERSEALARQVRSGWYPTVVGNLIFTRLEDDRTFNNRVVTPVNGLFGNVQLSIPLVAPRQWAAHARSKEATDVAAQAAVDTKRQVAVAAARAYLAVVGQHRVLETAQRAFETAKAHEDFARTRLGGGLGNRLDAVRASQERATTEGLVEVQQLALQRAVEALGVIVGRGAPVDIRGEATLAAPPGLQAALGETDTRRADVVAERARVELARKVAGDTYALYLPTLSAIGQPFFQTPTTSVLPNTGYSAQLVLSLPIYDGGSRSAVDDERRVLYEQEKTRLEGVLRQARSDVRLAFEAVRRADAALAQAREASNLSLDALKLATLAYRTGTISNIEVIDAERRARDADAGVAIAEDTARQARLDLLAGCGRFP